MQALFGKIRIFGPGGVSGTAGVLMFDARAGPDCHGRMNLSYQKIAEVKSAREGERSQFAVRAVLKSMQRRQAKNGSDFIMAEFGDNSGSMSVMCFGDSLAFAALSGASAGDAFAVCGVSDFYNGRFSPKIDSVSRLSEAEFEEALPELVESSPFPKEEMEAELAAIVESIPNEKLRATVKYALNDTGGAFFTSTAAIKMHHAYRCGLLEHSLNLARLAVKLLPMYEFVNPSLALAGAILHDIGKVDEYSQGLAADKTRIGVLQGHVVLGFKIVRKAALKCRLGAELTERLEHIILSHQGELEWGAAAIASTPEAVFVSMLDYLDARMGAVRSALRSGGQGEFSELVPALKTRILLTPPPEEPPSHRRIFVATSNAHKVAEFSKMFADWGLDCELLGAAAAGGMPTCEETGSTFAENALIKARALRPCVPSDAYVLADDSGICVDALGGRPGVRSARFAGVSGPGADSANNALLLKEMEGVPDGERSAHFACALALICPDGSEKMFEGRVDGFINRGAKGGGGFGYDPLFELAGEGLTTAEIPAERKNEISHRGMAVKKLAEFLAS